VRIGCCSAKGAATSALASGSINRFERRFRVAPEGIRFDACRHSVISTRSCPKLQ
jgi:hypothetical protein